MTRTEESKLRTQRAPLETPRAKPDKVKSLIIDLSKRYGGASTRAITLAKGMRDWEPAIAVLAGSPVATAAASQGILTVTVGRHRLDPFIPFRIAMAVQRGGYQIIDTQNIQSKVWGSIAALITGTVEISTLNSSYANEQGESLKGRLYSLLDRLTNWKVARYIAVSESIKASLCASGVPEGRIELIRNGIEFADPNSASPGKVRSSLGLPPDAILFTAVGRLVWAKGYLDLIAAFSEIAIEAPNLYCAIVGEGALHATLQAQIDQAGLSKRIFLIGYRPHEDVIDILNSSDAFAMSSRSEGIPYALLEAGSLGIPIVATRCGGIPEVVTDGVEALLVDAANPSALGLALASLARDPMLRKRLGASAMRRIREAFSVARQVEATKAAYVSALSADPKDP